MRTEGFFFFLFYSLLYFQDSVEYNGAQQIFVDVIRKFLKIRIICVMRRGVGGCSWGSGGGGDVSQRTELNNFSRVLNSPQEL